MARNKTHFESAERGRNSTYKFRIDDDPTCYVLFEYEGEKPALFTTPEGGPFRAAHPLEACPFPDLASLLDAKGTDMEEWRSSLMAQYGEYVGWAYP